MSVSPPDFEYHRVEIARLRKDLVKHFEAWEWARANDKVALGMARENLKGARESLREAIAEARHDFEQWVVAEPERPKVVL